MVIKYGALWACLDGYDIVGFSSFIHSTEPPHSFTIIVVVLSKSKIGFPPLTLLSQSRISKIWSSDAAEALFIVQQPLHIYTWLIALSLVCLQLLF